MPVADETNCIEHSNYLSAPVVSLKDGLPVSELIQGKETFFEVKADEDDDFNNSKSAESYFNFDDLEKVINLDVMDIDQAEDGEDNTPFDKYRRKMHDLRDDGKIKKFIVRQGVGPVVPANCLVYIRYQGYFEYEEVPFDSTLLQCGGEGDKLFPCYLGKGQLLPGLHEAVISMRKSEKAEFLIDPDLAYGKLGCPPRIPPDATVLFIVEVDHFVDCGDIYTNNEDDLSMEERNQFSNVIKNAKAIHRLGNDLFTKENYSTALNKYRQVINMMHNSRLANEEEEEQRNKLLIKLYTNACICLYKLKSYKKICSMASDAVRVDDKAVYKNPKLLYFWGSAEMKLGEFKLAQRYLNAAYRLSPNQEIAVALKELEEKKKRAEFNERVMMKRAFNFEPTKVTVTEIDEAQEAFRANIKEQLQDFKDNLNKDMLLLKDQFTVQEEEVCMDVANSLGLYARVIEGNKRIIQFKRRVED